MSEVFRIIKYPRTPHIEGSRLQPGDEDLSQIPFDAIAGRVITVEEKIDGANTAVSFDPEGTLLLQSRGHYLTGGYREKHYQFLKTWAQVHQQALHGVLGSRYIMYGEWMYAKHTIFYDALPHYFMEFDILDRETGRYLDTASRHELLRGLPVCSVPVLARRAFRTLEELTALVGPSCYITPRHIENLAAYCDQNGEDTAARVSETDPATTMEGLYIKVEEQGEVVERMKFVRASFLQNVTQSGTHWLNRPIIPNQLVRPIESLYAAELPPAKEGRS